MKIAAKKICFFSVFALLPAKFALSATLDSHVSIGFGAWGGQFKQAGNGFETKFKTNVGPAFPMQFGIKFGGVFFIDYCPALFLGQNLFSPSDTKSQETEEADYLSLIGIDFGVALPVLPLEVYLGIEYGNVYFSAGTDNDYHGYTWKAGSNLYFSGGKDSRWGVKAEYRRHMARTDDSGNLPASIDTDTDIFFAGLVFGR